MSNACPALASAMPPQVSQHLPLPLPLPLPEAQGEQEQEQLHGLPAEHKAEAEEQPEASPEEHGNGDGEEDAEGGGDGEEEEALGYIWRKYGEKTVGAKKHAVRRAYYRCICFRTHSPCAAKKRVDRLVHAAPGARPLSVTYVNRHRRAAADTLPMIPEHESGSCSAADRPFALRDPGFQFPMGATCNAACAQVPPGLAWAHGSLGALRAEDIAREMYNDLMVQMVEQKDLCSPFLVGCPGVPGMGPWGVPWGQVEEGGAGPNLEAERLMTSLFDPMAPLVSPAPPFPGFMGMPYNCGVPGHISGPYVGMPCPPQPPQPLQPPQFFQPPQPPKEALHFTGGWKRPASSPARSDSGEGDEEDVPLLLSKLREKIAERRASLKALEDGRIAGGIARGLSLLHSSSSEEHDVLPPVSPRSWGCETQGEMPESPWSASSGLHEGIAHEGILQDGGALVEEAFHVRVLNESPLCLDGDLPDIVIEDGFCDLPALRDEAAAATC